MPRVTFLKSRREVIALGCYWTRWTRWASHFRLRMKDITFLPWKLSQKWRSRFEETANRCVTPAEDLEQRLPVHQNIKEAGGFAAGGEHMDDFGRLREDPGAGDRS
jgi:hypothetical protein